MALKWPKNQRAQAYAQLEDVSDTEEIPRKSQPNARVWPQLLQCLLSFASGIIIALSFLSFVHPYLFQEPPTTDHVASSESSAANVAPELTLSPVPLIPLTTVTFEENKTFSARPSPETDRAWNHLLPPGRGFVFVENSSQYHLPPGQETQWGEIYSVAMFHELHCLGQLRKAYWTLIKGVETGDVRKSKLLLGKHGEHVYHCFDYLRQAITCAGDMSMEWPRTEADGRRIAVDGWGAKHTCKSLDTIQKYMAEKHFNNSMKLEIAI